jgi:hypothetical protein
MGMMSPQIFTFVCAAVGKPASPAQVRMLQEAWRRLKHHDNDIIPSDSQVLTAGKMFAAQHLFSRGPISRG